MPDRYAYYPGCSLESSAREFDVTTRLVCNKLNVGLDEIKDWTCCGAASAHSVDALMGVALPARTLESARKQNMPVMAPCPLCYSRLKFAAHDLRDTKTRDQVQDVLGDPIPSKAEYSVMHLLQLLDEHKGKIKVEKPLAGLKVASYYGCILVRPKELTRFDDVENPQMIDRLVNQLGAESVYWSFKTECCGGSHMLTRPDIVAKLSHRLLAQARQAGADCIAVACQACHANMDTSQKSIESTYKDGVGLPIIYITQLIALAMGVPAKELMFDKHFVDPRPMLQDKKLI
jgi:heterodisulfide reductase subunit B